MGSICVHDALTVRHDEQSLTVGMYFEVANGARATAADGSCDGEIESVDGCAGAREDRRDLVMRFTVDGDERPTCVDHASMELHGLDLR